MRIYARLDALLGRGGDNVVTFIPRAWATLSVDVQVIRLERLHVEGVERLNAYALPDDPNYAWLPKLSRQTAEGIDRIREVLKRARAAANNSTRSQP